MIVMIGPARGDRGALAGRVAVMLQSCNCQCHLNPRPTCAISPVAGLPPLHTPTPTHLQVASFFEKSGADASPAAKWALSSSGLSSLGTLMASTRKFTLTHFLKRVEGSPSLRTAFHECLDHYDTEDNKWVTTVSDWTTERAARLVLEVPAVGVVAGKVCPCPPRSRCVLSVLKPSEPSVSLHHVNRAVRRRAPYCKRKMASFVL